ncbi:MAG: hypothetical protein RR091_09105, partial [Cloacibacillus sp.]
ATVMQDGALRTAGAALHDAAGPKRQLARLGVDEFVVAAHGSFNEEIRVLDEEPDAVLKRADEALYRAKHEGKDRVCLS